MNFFCVVLSLSVSLLCFLMHLICCLTSSTTNDINVWLYIYSIVKYHMSEFIVYEHFTINKYVALMANAVCQRRNNKLSSFADFCTKLNHLTNEQLMYVHTHRKFSSIKCATTHVKRDIITITVVIVYDISSWKSKSNSSCKWWKLCALHTT